MESLDNPINNAEFKLFDAAVGAYVLGGNAAEGSGSRRGSGGGG